MFTLPETAVASSTAFVGEALTGYWPLIALAIGIPLAFYIIRRLISLIPGR